MCDLSTTTRARRPKGVWPKTEKFHRHFFCYPVNAFPTVDAGCAVTQTFIYVFCLLVASCNFLDSLDLGPTRHRFEGSHARLSVGRCQALNARRTVARKTIITHLCLWPSPETRTACASRSPTVWPSIFRRWPIRWKTVRYFRTACSSPRN